MPVLQNIHRCGMISHIGFRRCTTETRRPTFTPFSPDTDTWIVEEHKGSIEVHSEVGKGTKVEIKLFGGGVCLGDACSEKKS